MAGFKFKLEPLLRHRKRLEDQHRRVFLAAEQKRLALEGQIRDMQEQIRSEKHAMQDALIGKVQVARLREHAAHAGQVEWRVHQTLRDLASQHRQQEHLRQQLLESVKNRKVMEHLRARQRERWLWEQEAVETRQLDELATQGWGRRQSEGGVG